MAKAIQFTKIPDLSPIVGKLIQEGYAAVSHGHQSSLVANMVAKNYRRKGYSAIKVGPVRLFVKGGTGK